MRLTTIPLKRAAAVLATVCTLGTFCIAGSIAYAGNDGTGTVADAGANTANIQKKTTSITIHKYEGPSITETAFKPNGTDMTDALNGEGNKPLKGAFNLRFTK